MIALHLAEPWLVADLGRARRVLSFAPYRPGFVEARRILWRQVRNEDLAPGFDAPRWLADEVAALDGAGAAVAMMTSRGLAHWRRAEAGPVNCVATVGLGNAERVGYRRYPFEKEGYGTINIALAIDEGLTDAALLEALTIAAQARTAAVIDAGIRVRTGIATGTGTDCLALACDAGETGFAGLHTALGEAIGAAVYRAVAAGAADWVADFGTEFE